MTLSFKGYLLLNGFLLFFISFNNVFNFNLIDHFEKVSDKDGAIYTRRLAKEEGIFAGYSAGSAIAAINQLKDKLNSSDGVVVLLHDHGSRYVAKIFNDDWMKKQNFI